MKIIKSTIDNLEQKLKQNVKKVVVGIGALALLGTIAAKDNVHVGSTTLYNPVGNQYTIGLDPNTTIKGNAKGNVITMGLIVGVNELDEKSQLEGNMYSFGLAGGRNSVKSESNVTGNMTAAGLFISKNNTDSKSKHVGNMNSSGLIYVQNNIGLDSKNYGDMTATALIVGVNQLENNAELTGNIKSKGIFSWTSMDNEPSFLSETIIGLKDYKHHKKE